MAEAQGSRMKASSSAPVLRDSPYNQSIGPAKPKRRAKDGVWRPPPGGFNEPDLPHFEGPGPGQYTPKEQHSVLSTKPRVVGCRFGSEDRFKYLAPLRSLEGTSSGLLGGSCGPQAVASPGPAYMPDYSCVHVAARSSSFSVQRRDTSGADSIARGAAPGPGLYNPSDKALSTRKNYVAGGGFLADDRQKYLGELDPSSLTPSVSQSPGPLYMPSHSFAMSRAPTVSFGGHGPGTIKSVPSLKMPMPGPGAYTPIAQNAALSTKPRILVTHFGVEPRVSKGLMDSSMCFHKNVPVDMTHVHTHDLSPGPSYNPSIAPIKRSYQKPIIGTAKRFSRVPIIVK
ncbi:hypothetical protein AB1Y20_019630 [Prymnesium parvum]|uniref:Uncharacterized protein n=1 Tax=Prymnesium parvum TaxID=97485 RepID=A0AB34JV52_PRYPA